MKRPDIYTGMLFYQFIRTRPATVIFILLVALLFLPGCAGPTEYVRVPIEVKVPVPVPCIAEVDPPRDYATSELNKKSSDGDIVRAMLIEIEERSAVELYLRAAIAGCSPGVD